MLDELHHSSQAGFIFSLPDTGAVENVKEAFRKMLSGHVLAVYHLYYRSLTQFLHVIFCVPWPPVRTEARKRVILHCRNFSGTLAYLTFYLI